MSVSRDCNTDRKMFKKIVKDQFDSKPLGARAVYLSLFTNRGSGSLSLTCRVSLSRDIHTRFVTAPLSMSLLDAVGEVDSCSFGTFLWRFTVKDYLLGFASFRLLFETEFSNGKRFLDTGLRTGFETTCFPTG